jgi:hypothetical protein
VKILEMGTVLELSLLLGGNAVAHSTRSNQAVQSTQPVQAHGGSNEAQNRHTWPTEPR